MNQSNSKKNFVNYNSLKSFNNFLTEGGQRVQNQQTKTASNEPLITIITVVKNSEENILKTIKSVTEQNYNNLEYIIIDGNSSDKTLSIIKTYEKKINYWCSINDEGIYDAMNYGIMLSKGEIIGMINSGDIFKEKALTTVANYFKNNKDLSYLFGTVQRHYLGNNVILKSGFDKNRIRYNFDSITCHSSGFFIRAKVQREIGLYNTKYKCSSDYDLFYKLLRNEKFQGTFTKKEELIGIVASGGFSSKYGFWKKLKEEILIRIDNGQNKLLILIIFLNVIFKSILKKLNIR